MEKLTEESLDAQRVAHEAFDRMRRARDRGTGCHLTADMIFALNTTFLGEVMSDTSHVSALKDQS